MTGITEVSDARERDTTPKKLSDEEIFNWTKGEWPYVEPKNAKK